VYVEAYLVHTFIYECVCAMLSVSVYACRVDTYMVYVYMHQGLPSSLYSTSGVPGSEILEEERALLVLYIVCMYVYVRANVCMCERE